MCDEKKKSIWYRGCTGEIIPCPICTQKVCNYHGASNNGGLKGGHGGCSRSCEITGALKPLCTGYMSKCPTCEKFFCGRHTLTESDRAGIGSGHKCKKTSKTEADDATNLNVAELGDALDQLEPQDKHLTPKPWSQRLVDELKLPSEVSDALDKEGIEDAETLIEYTKDQLVAVGIKGGHAIKILKHVNTDVPTASSLPLRNDGIPQEFGKWDFFISHTQRSGLATTLAAELYADLQEAGYSCWLDVKMDSKSADAMKNGVINAKCLLAIITGPLLNPDLPTDSVESNAYFSREYCVQELRWAKEAGVFIQPLIRMEDKHKIAEFMQAAPPDLRELDRIDFIDLIRSDKRYWKVGIEKITEVLRGVHANGKARLNW
eukprot:m.48403 g.48403  ORF g.48403 m.48403 type:complete len:376 (+) comp20737_c0_seq1:79-1206(+)